MAEAFPGLFYWQTGSAYCKDDAMNRRGSIEAEPRPLPGTVRFEEGDFHALSEGLCGDPQYDDRRLVTRRKLLALGKRCVRGAAEEGLALDCRTSLHRPHAFNGNRVRRIWCYLMRPAGERKRLRSLLGPELGRDLDAAFRNAYLCLAVEAQALEVSLRIHPEAWYDGQNLKKRIAREGPQAWRALLNGLPGWSLVMHDWKGEWRCGQLEPERLDEYLEAWTPGEHRLSLVQRFPAPAGARGPALSARAPGELVSECLRLAPAYRYAAWSRESDFLFAD